MAAPLAAELQSPAGPLAVVVAARMGLARDSPQADTLLVASTWLVVVEVVDVADGVVSVRGEAMR